MPSSTAVLRRDRLFIVVLLLAGQVALFPLYAQQPINEHAWVLPGPAEFVESPEQYAGERVVAGGTVQATSPIVFQVETTTGTHLITLVGAELSAEPGDKVRVYGVLTAPQKVRVLHAFVVPRGGLLFTWTVSFLAGLWVMSRFVRHWTVDWSTLGFHRRKRPIGIHDLARWLSSGEGQDA